MTRVTSLFPNSFPFPFATGLTLAIAGLALVGWRREG
jgi:hypothetical protein